MSAENTGLTLYQRKLIGCMRENRLDNKLTAEEVMNEFVNKHPDQYYKGEFSPSTHLEEVEQGLVDLALLGLVKIDPILKKKGMPLYLLTDMGIALLQDFKKKG